MLRKKTAAIAGPVALVMIIGAGAAFGTPGDSSSSSSSSTTSTTVPLPAPADGEMFAYEVAGAGMVTVQSDGNSLSIVSATAMEGWAAEVEVAQGREVEADFRNGERRVQFNAELEDGQIRVRVRERVGDDRTEEVTFTNPSTSQSTATTPTPQPSSTADALATTTYAAGEAGSVTIARDADGLTIVSVEPANGWSTEIEVSLGREVEVDFRNGNRRIQFNAELEDGEVEIRVRDRVDDDHRDRDDLDDDNSDHGNSDDEDGAEDEGNQGNDDRAEDEDNHGSDDED